MIECIKRAQRYNIHVCDAKSRYSDARIITGYAGPCGMYSASRGFTVHQIMSAKTDIVSEGINAIIDEILEDMARDMKFVKIEVRSTDAQNLTEVNTRIIQLAQAGDLKVELNGNTGKLASAGIGTDPDGVTTLHLEWTELHDIGG